MRHIRHGSRDTLRDFRPYDDSAETPGPRAAVSMPSGMAKATGLPDASAWAMDPAVAYLNHGSFGATPVAVLAEQQRLRTAMERNPVGFLGHQLPELLDAVRAEVAAFLGADPEGLVFVDNATTGTQTVIAQARLGPGDEVLATDHCYPAVLAQLRRSAEAAGARLEIAEVPLPAPGRAEVAEAVLSRLTDRTRLLVIDHVASCSGLVFPVEEIVAECRRQGVPVLVDGAHAAGMLPVDLGRLGAEGVGCPLGGARVAGHAAPAGGLAWRGRRVLAGVRLDRYPRSHAAAVGSGGARLLRPSRLGGRAGAQQRARPAGRRARGRAHWHESSAGRRTRGGDAARAASRAVVRERRQGAGTPAA
jgi:Aminotransferase class-V